MARIVLELRRRPAVVLLGIAAVVTLAVVVSGRTGSDFTPSTLGGIRSAVDRFIGQRVQVTGVVRRFHDRGDAPYYVLEDAQHNRVGLRPSAKLEGLVGCRTTVRGVVEFAPDFGIYVAVSGIGFGCGR